MCQIICHDRATGARVPPAATDRTPVSASLLDRLTATRGTQYLPGLQALVRLPLEQARRDREAGLRMGTLISGYPGSPLAGYDLQLARHRTLLEEWGVRHLPAGNEEQAATALTGTQMLDDYPHSRYDGVVGFWYGKGPGIDRSGDALKHGNFAGTSRHGAVVLLSGEDHEGKSSTMPFQNEWSFEAAGIPILYPSSVAEFLTLGLHAVALSRYSGCWVAMKLVGQLCDGGETVSFPLDVAPVLPMLDLDGRPFAKRTDFTFFPGRNIETERQLFEERHAAALAYARANNLVETMSRPSHARVGIVSAGKSLADVRQALDDLGVRESDVALLAVKLIYPLDAGALQAFSEGLEEVVVVEEKRGFLEDGVRRALQSLRRPPLIVGKHDEHGARLFPLEGGLDAESIAPALVARLGPHLQQTVEATRLNELVEIRSRAYDEHAGRTPNYCSGCPHSTSTVLAEEQLAWGSPGCHSFAAVIEQPERHVETMTQLGGEGAPWIGLSWFTDREHLIQNVGDGSLYHSSYLNVRFAVASGVSITFKVLYNGAVANTGAQQAVGQRGVAELTRALAAEGVTQTVVVTKDPRRYRRSKLGERTSVRPVRELVTVTQELQQVTGTTVLIYDESCANERRRLQKRGTLERPNRFTLINEAVCENCGDCGAKSNCMSLQKVETEFGPKTQIHASSCNQDYSCLAGDCPSFVTVETDGGRGYRKPPLPEPSAPLPEPRRPRLIGPYRIYTPGVGGTGVLTLNALLAMGAQLDGLGVLSYDQTGAAQKWGPVLSSLIIVPPGAQAHANKVGLGRADLYLALDEVAAVTPVNLDRCDSGRTAVVRNIDLLPTGEMIRDVWFEFDRSAMAASLRKVTRPDAAVDVPARTLAERLFGDYMATNLVVLGAAYQSGFVPISADSIEAAIRLNEVAVDQNLAAFHAGRLWVHHPDTLRDVLDPPRPTANEEIKARAGRLGRRGRAYRELLAPTDGMPQELRRLLAVRVADLIDYQSVRYAERYLRDVLRVWDAERRVDHNGALTTSVARNLHKLMAYKDEYEVARLYLAPEFRRQVETTFEGSVKIRYQLHPPFARALGRDRKVEVGGWFRGPLRILYALRRMRATPLDPFARQRSRREERKLISWYRELLDRILERDLDERRRTVALELANLPDQIRGYEQIKSQNAARAHHHAKRLLTQLEGRTTLPLVPS